jgi:hypothetical protein
MSTKESEPLMMSIALTEWLRLDAVAKAARTLVKSAQHTPIDSDPHTERVGEMALTVLESALDAAGYGIEPDDLEPPEDDGECFRDGEAASFNDEQQARIQRELKR